MFAGVKTYFQNHKWFRYSAYFIGASYALDAACIAFCAYDFKYPDQFRDYKVIRALRAAYLLGFASTKAKIAKTPEDEALAYVDALGRLAYMNQGFYLAVADRIARGVSPITISPEERSALIDWIDKAQMEVPAAADAMEFYNSKARPELPKIAEIDPVPVTMTPCFAIFSCELQPGSQRGRLSFPSRQIMENLHFDENVSRSYVQMGVKLGLVSEGSQIMIDETIRKTTDGLQPFMNIEPAQDDIRKRLMMGKPMFAQQ